MRKLAILALVAALALAVSTSVSAGPGPVGGMYEWHPGMGTAPLHLVNAEGQLFAAFDAQGHLVMEGFVGADHFVVPCPNCGPGQDGQILNVVLGNGVSFSFVLDDPDDWMWE